MEERRGETDEGEERDGIKDTGVELRDERDWM